MRSSTTLPAVEDTKQLLAAPQGWGMWVWASEANQDCVRRSIESATEALDREVEKSKKSWGRALQNADGGDETDPRIRRAVRRLRDAEEQTSQLTAQSKTTFAEAERELDAGKARRGVSEALRAIEMHEKVLELARRLGR